MILNKKTAEKLEVLVHPDIEKAILTLLNYIEEVEMPVLRDPDASMEHLKILQGKFILLRELKEYKQRILDAIKSLDD